MVLGVVMFDGKKMPLHFFKPVEKVGAEVYYKVLRYKVLPWLKVNFPNENNVWTQDGALPLTAKKCNNSAKTILQIFGQPSSGFHPALT